MRDGAEVLMQRNIHQDTNLNKLEKDIEDLEVDIENLKTDIEENKDQYTEVELATKNLELRDLK